MAKKKAKKKASANSNGKTLNSQQSVNSAVKSICDIMRRSNCAGAMQYVPELTWILFLRILDERETLEAEAAEAVGADFTPSIKKPYRWQDWAAPDSKRREEMLTQGKVLEFVNGELLPYLKGLRNKPNSTPRQKVISEILSGVERVRIDTQKNLCDVCDKVHGLSADTIDEKIESPDQLELLRHDTFFGREKENLIYPIALANLVLHGIDQPNIWHGNTLTGGVAYDRLFQNAPDLFDVVMTNPPFGGKEGPEAQTRFAFKTGATQVLFLQHVIDSLKPTGRCGIVLDEGVLFRTNETAFVQTKRKLLDECNLYCIISLPGGVFNAAGAGVKTNLLFFNKGEPTEKIWYYDLSDVKVGKRRPFTLDKFDEFFKLLSKRKDSERSWTADFVARKKKAADEAAPLKKQATAKQQEANRWKEELGELKKAKPSPKQKIAEAEQRITELTKEARELAARAQDIEDAVYDLKAVNPNKQVEEDTRTPAELLDTIEAKGREVAETLAVLRSL